VIYFFALQVKDRLKKMGLLQPLNIFLRQEIDRMQRVISIVRTTLSDLKLAIDGTIIMSENLRDALDNMFDARVPNTWKKVRNATLNCWKLCCVHKILNYAMLALC
jgi:dynein heavy chain